MAIFDLQEETQSLQDLSNYDIPNERDISSLDSRRVDSLLEGAVEVLADSSDAITRPVIFDTYRSFLKYSSVLQGSTMTKLLDSVSSAFIAEVESTLRDEDEDQETYMAHKSPLEMYAFLLHWFVIAAEKVKSSEDEEEAPPAPRPKRGRGGKAAANRARKTQSWSWIGQIPATLSLICKVLRLKTQRIWIATAERDTFIKCLTSPAYRAAENTEYMKDKDQRNWVYKVICLAVKHHGHALAAQITIMQNLQFFEHLGEPMAEMLYVLVKEYDHQPLCDEVLREVAGKTYSMADNKGGRTTSRFLVKLVELLPRSVLKQFSLLVSLLDSEFYPIRVALVEVIGALIEDMGTAQELSEQNEETVRNQLNTLYDVLLERTLDLSVYVRSKALNILAKLCDLPVKFPKLRLSIAMEAVACLEDSSSIVRKGAVILLKQLIVTHPYGLMFGGLLQLTEWESRYNEVKERLQKVQGEVEKVIEGEQAEGSQEGEEDQEEGEEEGEEDSGEGEESGEGEGPRKRKRLRKRRREEDEMDVDEDEEQERTREEDDEGNDDDQNDNEDVEMVDGEERPKKSKKKHRRKSELNIERLNDAVVVEALQGTEIMQLKLTKKYCAEGLSFIRQIESSLSIIEDLLASKSKPEVLEAMDFFRIVFEYQLEGVESGIKRMLHLIWSKDDSSTSEDGEKLKGLRPRLLECYQSMYFDPLADLEPKQQVNRIAKNMIELTYDATLAELTSLEEMMRIMMDNGHIHSDVIAKLWQVYGSDRPLPRPQRRGAVIMLGMLALARRSVVADCVDTLVRIGLGNKGRADLTLAKYTCIALQRLNGSAKKVKGSLLDKNIRLEAQNPLFKKLQDAIEHPCRTKEWFGMAEQAINTIYALAERPDLVCEKIIKDLTQRAFAPKSRQAERQASQAAHEPDAMDEDSNADPNISDISGPQDTKDGDKDVGDAFELSQLLFVVGHVAIKQIVFLEQVEREWKRQKHERETAEKAAGRNDARGAKDNGEELDQVAGNAEDEIGERIAHMRESELLYGPNSLLAVFGPMLVHICGSPPKFKNRTLRAAATLAFSKFLCVSSQFCDQHHRLLFKILETSKDPTIRSNIVIALGDVAVSFSNIIDENSNELYKGLSDRNVVVKKNTLMVLTHLILNGMIKVKGQLGEMAKCLEDTDERIGDLAKLFFSELATKDNAIYNNLPDVISHLSVGDHAVDEETFQSTMTYIFKFIEKERQAENIVEKLCQRFRLTEEPRQWRDIAFCLSLLPFKSERSVKRLIEGLPHYRDKLHEEEVFSRFQEILTKARANKARDKPDAELNEFEQILEEHKRQGAEDQEFEKRVQGKKAAAKKRATRRTARKKVQAEESD